MTAKTTSIDMGPVEDYVALVRSSPEKFAKATRQCIERVAATCEIVRADGPIIYRPKTVEKVFKFFDELVELDGSHFQLLDWQRFLIACIYGFRHKSDNRILYNDIFLFIAKKNGKTAFTAGNALYRFFSKQNAKVFLTATDYEQAKISLDDIKQYIKRTPRFAKLLDADRIKLRELPTPLVELNATGSEIKIIPESRAGNSQGRKPDFILFDEIASYSTSDIIQKLSTGIVDPTAVRFSLTTAETNIDNPGYFEYQRAKSILEGKMQADNYLPLIFEMDPGDDPWDEANYIKANPSLDKIKPLWKLVEDRDRARNDPLEESAFFAYHLNVWANAPAADIPIDVWRPAIEQHQTYRQYLTDKTLADLPAFGAIDLSRVDDYTAFTVYFYVKQIDRFYAKHKFYLPAGQIERRFARESEQIRTWVSKGWITLTYDGSNDMTINYEFLRDDVLEALRNYKGLVGIAYDPTFSNMFFETLRAEDQRGFIMVPFSQQYKKIAPANKEWYDLILKGRLIDNNPVMQWMVGNVKRREDRNKNMSFVKANYSQSNLRIDGVDTSVMAYSSLLAQIDVGGYSNEDIEEAAKKLEAIDY